MSSNANDEDVVMPEPEPEQPVAPKKKSGEKKSKQKKTVSGLSKIIKLASGQVVNSEKPQKKPRRCRAGTVVKREIRRLKNYSGCFLKKIPFQNLVRSLTIEAINELYPSHGTEQKQVKFERGALETFRLDAGRQLDAAVGAANIINVSEGKERLSWESFDVLQQIRQRFPGCLTMFTPEYDCYRTLRYLVKRLISLGEKYSQIMHEILKMGTEESYAFLQKKIRAIMTKRLKLAAIKFDPNSSLADLERIYYEEYRSKSMCKKLSAKIKDAMSKGAGANSAEVGELAQAYKNAQMKK